MMIIGGPIMLQQWRATSDTVMPSHFPSQHVPLKWSRTLSRENLPFAAGLLFSTIFVFQQKYSPSSPHSNNNFFFFLLKSHCLLFTVLYRAHWVIFWNTRHQNSLFRAPKESTAGSFLSAHFAKDMNRLNQNTHLEITIFALSVS